MWFRKFFCWFAVVALLVGCQATSSNADNTTSTASSTADATSPVTEAIAILAPTEGNETSGVIKFQQQGDGVLINAEVRGLGANAVHAWHIHEFGDISDPAGKATGGHYNPEENPHALPNTPVRHAGDLGNLTADENGVATTELTVENISIAGSKNPILGRGFIVHADADDGGQPTGNAGGRIAQGVIGIRQPL